MLGVRRLKKQASRCDADDADGEFSALHAQQDGTIKIQCLGESRKHSSSEKHRRERGVASSLPNWPIGRKMRRPLNRAGQCDHNPAPCQLFTDKYGTVSDAGSERARNASCGASQASSSCHGEARSTDNVAKNSPKKKKKAMRGRNF